MNIGASLMTYVGFLPPTICIWETHCLIQLASNEGRSLGTKTFEILICNFSRNYLKERTLDEISGMWFPTSWSARMRSHVFSREVFQGIEDAISKRRQSWRNMMWLWTAWTDGHQGKHGHEETTGARRACSLKHGLRTIQEEKEGYHQPQARTTQEPRRISGAMPADSRCEH